VGRTGRAGLHTYLCLYVSAVAVLDQVLVRVLEPQTATQCTSAVDGTEYLLLARCADRQLCRIFTAVKQSWCSGCAADSACSIPGSAGWLVCVSVV
jgi:hypothetical protein